MWRSGLKSAGGRLFKRFAPDRKRGAHNTAPALVFAVILLFGGIAAYVAFDAARRAEQAQFRVIAGNAVSRIELRINQHIAMLQATRAFFLANGGRRDRASFKAFAELLDPARTLRGIQGLGFAEVVQRDDTADLESGILQNYGLDRQVWPDTTEDIRAVITLLEPSNLRNATALGYDMFAEPTRRAAMRLAMTSGLPSASGPVELVQEITNKKQIGFLVYLPIFDARSGERDVEGFIYAPFRTGDLFTSVAEENAQLPVMLRVTDITDNESGLIYEDQSFGATARFSSLATTETIDVAGRAWRVHALPGPTFQASQARRLSFGIVFLLLALALAMASLTRAAMQRNAVAEELRVRAEKDLIEKELILQEMQHRIKNSLGRVLAIARQTSRGAKDMGDFYGSFSARLQAMASAQDMLSKSHWQTADLRALLMQELKQVFDQDEIGDSLVGPAVELSERGAQAFGLVFHELATNALKYGAATARDLAVTWKLDRAVNPAELQLVWTEKLPGGGTEPQIDGFGTRLIDLNIRLELGGSVRRRFDEHGMVIELRVPVHAVVH